VYPSAKFCGRHQFESSDEEEAAYSGKLSDLEGDSDEDEDEE
jgi:hypothetical protein